MCNSHEGNVGVNDERSQQANNSSPLSSAVYSLYSVHSAVHLVPIFSPLKSILSPMHLRFLRRFQTLPYHHLMSSSSSYVVVVVVVEIHHQPRWTHHRQQLQLLVFSTIVASLLPFSLSADHHTVPSP